MRGTDVLDILALAHALVDAGWTQGFLARRKDGQVCPATAPEAERYCLLGALDAAGFGLSRPSVAGQTAVQLVADAARECGLTPIPFNDAPGRRKRDVLRLIERAAAKVGKS